MPEKKPNLHEGHRKRVKERFIKFGVDSFTDVQLLETLLFYAVPKKDTNDTAHLLLDTFGGTFAKVLNADYKELVTKHTTTTKKAWNRRKRGVADKIRSDGIKEVPYLFLCGGRRRL